MPIYATPADLESWSSTPATPAQLRAASGVITDAVRRDVYDTTPEGVPVAPRLRDAMRDATCAQVAYWLAHDIDPLAGAAAVALVETSSSINGASVSVDAAAAARQAAEQVDSLSRPVPAAMRELRAAGLGSAAVMS